MAKPRKSTKPEKEQMLETPAGTAVATEAPIRQDWPEATETRELTVKLSDEERIQSGLDLVEQMNKTTAITAEKKHAMKQFSIRIDKSKEAETRISEAVTSGIGRRQINCRWLWQTNAFDASGNAIFHSEMKTLVREDTGEVVECKPIVFEDRELFAPASAEELLEVNMTALTDAGFSLIETPDDSHAETPFVLVDPDGDETPVEADSMAEAAVQARAILSAQEGSESSQAHDTEDEE